MFVIRNRILNLAGWLWICFLASIFLMAAQPIQADPVARWDFDGEPGERLIRQGNVQGGQPGPRPPEFPDMTATNTSVRFDGQGSYYSIPDEGASSRFDFTNGDAISIDIPQLQADKMNDDPYGDTLVSGLYIIVDLCHYMTAVPPGCYTKLNLVRDSYGRKPEGAE